MTFTAEFSGTETTWTVTFEAADEIAAHNHINALLDSDPDPMTMCIGLTEIA